jgi:NADPH2:quinone reductase
MNDTNTSRAIAVSTPGGLEAMRLTDVPTPKPGPGELLVEVAAAGVNFIDIYFRTGRYPKPTPFVLGQEGAGTVLEVGADVGDVAVGDRVAWADGSSGSYAERVIVGAERAVPVPDDVPLDVAAASMLQGMTMHYLTRSTYPVQAGDEVLVHAAAGGMGLLLTQAAKHVGAHVVGTVSTAEKEQLARAAGADEVIRYDGLTAEQLAARVRELTGGAGVHVVYDGVGASTFEASLASLRPRGTLALFGAASGPVPPFDLTRLMSAGSLFATRPTLVDYVATSDELRARAGDVLGWIRAGELEVRIGARYPLAEAAKAQDDLQSRRTTGKLLLIP